MNRANDYYNTHKTKWLQDFCEGRGTSRIKAAIRYACGKLIENKSREILDLGCGIGWSSYEFARHLPCANISAVDFSEELLEMGRILFPDNRIKFQNQDITDETWQKGQTRKFDACVMLDVYEHVPSNKRRYFNKAVSQILKKHGIVILTCPTYLHQKFLRENNPQGLQPVDEDITLDTVKDLADALSGEVVDYSFRHVFKTNDYFYATIQRNCTSNTVPVSGDPPVQILKPRQRLRMTKNLESLIPKAELEKVRAPLRVSGRLKRLPASRISAPLKKKLKQILKKGV